MKFLLALFVLFAALNVVAADHHNHRDVCILGGGASGMTSAVFLKDRGYTSVVFEQADILGGCCNTENFPAPPGKQNWVDAGVVAFYNTTMANAMGLGNWTTDIAAFFLRFVSSLTPVPIPPTLPVYYADFKAGTVVPPPPFNVTAFEIALNKYYIIVAENPWLNTLTTRPDPIPAMFTVPFSQFITDNGLEALTSLFHEGINAGGTNFSAMSAFDAMRLSGASVGLTSTIVPELSFSAYGGCYSLYVGMTKYLGVDNVITSAKVSHIIRPHAHSDDDDGSQGPIIVQGHVGRSRFTYTCEKLIMALPHILRNLVALDLDREEANLFGKVTISYYFTSAVDAQGPITNNSDFALLNYQVNSPYGDGTPVAPAPFEMFRGLFYGLTVLALASDVEVTPEQIVQLTAQQLANIPNQYLTEVNYVRKINYHQYTPRFAQASDLLNSPTAYTKLDNQQGKHNTYWYSTLNTAPGHCVIINEGNIFISKYFPSKLAVRSYEETVVPAVHQTRAGIATLASHLASLYKEKVTMQNQGVTCVV